MELRRQHPLRRSKASLGLSLAPNESEDCLGDEAPQCLRASSSLRVMSRARSWIALPLDSTMSFESSSSLLESGSITLESGSTCMTAGSYSTAIPTTTAPSAPTPSIESFPFLPFIQGISRSRITYEALLALLLSSINVRELIGNGADAVVKALVKKAVALTAALLIATLLDCASGIDIDVTVLQGMAGTISGWVGAQASDPLGWKIEQRIADWLWPKPTATISIVPGLLSTSVSLPAGLAASRKGEENEKESSSLPRPRRRAVTSLFDAIPVLI